MSEQQPVETWTACDFLTTVPRDCPCGGKSARSIVEFGEPKWSGQGYGTICSMPWRSRLVCVQCGESAIQAVVGEAKT